MKQKVATFENEEILAYTIKNKEGMILTALNYGAAITEISVPDKYGKKENVVVAYDNIEDYETNPYYLGVVVGRTAGRTKEGVLTFNGEYYQLARNDGNNHLHGGITGLAKRVWNVEENPSSLIFTYVSEDGEDGYPGKVSFKITYELSDNRDLIVSYYAETDSLTPINLTNHTYFNLSGNKKRDIQEHSLQVASSHVYELDNESIPTGIVSVDEFPEFDFRNSKKVKEALVSNHEQIIRVGKGIDHPFLLDDHSVKEKIILADHMSGRQLSVKTTDPAVVIYSGNQIESTPLLNGGTASKYDGICLETQMPPNETERYLINKGDIYQKQTIFSFKMLQD
ncbi:galactose mutarotase [Salipaludibacillus sp. LMS25]|uniref:aldose epimerase family protein n=1 Tax=Salipaludibacillus sp. LMS25 TaxID=2924031 RepID=UPI0020D05BFE|nr:aldose epimerase family protein [Salipaludibacillus sp. LMS25]UTR14147.1 galactose mutarotase [Salipaludibacillus sp. LMS25]